MKTLILISAMLSILNASASWLPFGPEGISSNNVCFVIDNQNNWAICHDEGMCLYDHATQSWTDYPSNLPVKDAYYLDGTKILTILSDGTNSDGIYIFDPATGQYELIKNLDSPHFLDFNNYSQEYFVGHHLGLITSTDGITWTDIITLNNRNIVAMDSYENHFVCSEMDNLSVIWCSNDSGITWAQAPAGSPMISCMGFDSYGKLYGIFPDESYSSGLWSSTDYGLTWEVEFWSENMSCVGFDALGKVFIGWGENTSGYEEGVAWYNPDNGTVNFINDGLSSLIIKKITLNPNMSAIAIFCCTANGAFVTNSPVGIYKDPGYIEGGYLNIIPNPVKETALIEYHIPGQNNNTILLICEPEGKIIKEFSQDNSFGNLRLNCSEFSSGLYYIVLKNEKFSFCKKMVKN